VIAAFAALMHPTVNRVTLKHAPHSFEAIALQPASAWPMSCLPWGVLKHFDMPDVYNALRAKKLRLIEPWNAMTTPSGVSHR
jgi:hypothetical protein